MSVYLARALRYLPLSLSVVVYAALVALLMVLDFAFTMNQALEEGSGFDVTPCDGKFSMADCHQFAGRRPAVNGAEKLGRWIG